jgi:hypothetical protein
MKIRSGFVSNSSTSSFVVCGISMDTEEFEEQFHEEVEKAEDVFDVYEAFTEKSDLEYAADDCHVVFGIPLLNMQDFETLSQFKQRVRAVLSDKFGTDVTVGLIDCIVQANGELDF